MKSSNGHVRRATPDLAASNAMQDFFLCKLLSVAGQQEFPPTGTTLQVRDGRGLDRKTLTTFIARFWKTIAERFLIHKTTIKSDNAASASFANNFHRAAAYGRQ
jgi:hypothetical protein